MLITRRRRSDVSLPLPYSLASTRFSDQARLARSTNNSLERRLRVRLLPDAPDRVEGTSGGLRRTEERRHQALSHQGQCGVKADSICHHDQMWEKAKRS